MTLAERLRAAKKRIETEGWCQGDDKAIFGRGRHGYCAANALTIADASWSYQTKAMADAGEFFRKVNCITGGIGDWNDAPERTLADVLAAYDKAITAAEAT